MLVRIFRSCHLSPGYIVYQWLVTVSPVWRLAILQTMYIRTEIVEIVHNALILSCTRSHDLNTCGRQATYFSYS